MLDNKLNGVGLNAIGGSLLSETDALKLGIDVCEVLLPYSRINAAHKGVYPDNIFVDVSGTYTLGKPSDDIGDVAFAAPEVMRGGDFDARADIYSLGMVLEYLTGDGVDADNSPLSEGFRAIIRKACAPDPDKRFATVLDMKNALMSLHASMYFDGVSVSIAEEVHKQTDGVCAVRNDIRTTELDVTKHKAAEASAKRTEFTAPWDDTVVVNVSYDDENSVSFDEDAGDTIVVPQTDDTVGNDTVEFDFDDDEISASDVIVNSANVTAAQKIAFESRHGKKSRVQGASGKNSMVAVAVIVCVTAVLLLGCIIAGALLISNAINSGEDVVLPAQSISIVSKPSELTYYIGENINTAGLVLEAIYEDGSAETLTGGFTIEPAEARGVGRQTVTVTYMGVSASYEIAVLQKQVSALYLEELPSRREFAIGEEFDFSGMLIDVLFVDGSHQMITEGYTVEPASSVEVGEKKVTVSYGEKSVSFIVNVVEVVVDKIELVEPPKKLDYYVGESFSTDGLVILAEYPNGTSGEISSGFTVSPEKFTETGEQTVTVMYGGKTLEFDVSVSRANMTRLAVRTMPAKTAYTLGEALSMKGFSMWAYYDNGAKQIITNSYAYTPKTLTSVGTQTITVTYLGKSTSFEVRVTDPTPVVTGISVARGPVRTGYVIGDTLETAGISINVHYSDGKTSTVMNGFTCSPITFSTAGKQSVTVTYQDFATSFEVTVSPPITIDGTCGDKATWKLENGVLTISGTGEIDSYSENGAPWTKYSGQIRTVTVEGGITSIGAYAFAGTLAETLNISDTVRKIDKTALYKNCNLITINVDTNNRTFICKDASLLSKDGTKLYAVATARYANTYTVPDTVTTVEGYKIFCGSSIKEVVISKSLYSIDPMAFACAEKLEKFTVNTRNVAFTDVDGVLYTKNMNALVCYPMAKAGNTYTVPEGVTVIREGAFAYNAAVKELTLPSSLIRIDVNAFYETAKLTSVIYTGKEAGWANVDKGSGNDVLTNASVTYGG